MRQRRTILAMIGLVISLCSLQSAAAVSPNSVQRGRELFEREWQPRDPRLGSDGLGPLFNARSCVACHNQGGTGGGGVAEFNAKTIAIEQMEITGGKVDNDIVARMVRTFHPGFVQPNGSVMNTLALAHHGGSHQYREFRNQVLSHLPARFSESGGPIDAGETRYSSEESIRFTRRVGDYTISLQARLFHRNTSALFGSGLIDQISDRELLHLARAQKSHPEISGRPSTLADGRIGKFGWRANVASLIEFNDQACANEVGLETERMQQGVDSTNPGYRNPAADIRDSEIELMTVFLSELPAPKRLIHDDSYQRMKADRGKEFFHSVGCAVCHVEDLGPAKGIYSDILLHDMGYESMDLNPAEPYIVRRSPDSTVTLVSGSRNISGMGGYYGGSTPINVTNDMTAPSRPEYQTRPEYRGSRTGNGYQFRAPEEPTAKFEIQPLQSRSFTKQSVEKTDRVDRIRGDLTVTTTATYSHNVFMRNQYEKTKFNQEWRTPPLWGVADSAPYLHDGRAATLLEAIAMHDGEAAGTRDRFLTLPLADRQALIAFLETLVAPPGPIPRS